MIAYDGKEPYIFASYSHKDQDIVLKVITFLKQKMCRVWYDEGLNPGESWNDTIAEHLMKCEQFIVFITPDSVISKYVLSEVNYAVSKDKDIVPIVLKKTELPAGLDMMLGTVQMLDISDIADIGVAVDKIIPNLNKSVFSLTGVPFLQDLGYSFYLCTQNVEQVETNKKKALGIFCKDEHGNETELFSMNRLGAYDVSYNISSIDAIKDYFYAGKIRGVYQINIKCYYSLEYPLYGPDVDVLLVFILRIPRHGAPTFKLVDYQYMNAISPSGLEDEENLDVVGEKGWSTQIKNYLEGLLYK